MDFIYYTGRGLPPYLSSHSLAHVSLALPHFFSSQSLFSRISLPHYTCTHKSETFLTIKDVLSDTPGVQGSAKHDRIVIGVPQNTQITLEAYLNFAKAAKTDWFVSFSEEAGLKSGKKRAERASTHAVQALDDCLSAKIPIKILGNVQGGRFADFRIACIASMLSRNVDGLYFGGVYHNEHGISLRNLLKASCGALTDYQKPLVLSGPGRPLDVVFAAQLGFTHFESVWPFKLAGEGKALVLNFENLASGGQENTDAEYEEMVLDVNDPIFRYEKGPIMPGCECLCCREHQIGYLFHLLQVKEMTAHTLIALHNMQVYEGLRKFIVGLKEKNLLSQAYSIFTSNCCTLPLSPLLNSSSS
jgi:tRNA-guanine family transglycosylase